ncbi:MAG: hypothetical protein U5K84_08090 [Alkalibacterium sp.]|nr:hypothetical protein [Alkalibacterium sp.]
MQSVEIVSLADNDDEDLLEGFSKETSDTKTYDFKGRLQDVEYAIDYLDDYVAQPGLIEKLKSKREVFSLAELEKYVEKADIDSLLEGVSTKEREINKLDEELNNLRQEEQFLRKWRGLNFLPREVKQFNLMHVMIGTVDIERSDPLIASIKENGKVYYEEVYRRSDEVAYLFILPKDAIKALTDSINQYSYSELEYDYSVLPEDALYRNLSEQKEKREIMAESEEGNGWLEISLQRFTVS